jgi:hypothetical protein
MILEKGAPESGPEMEKKPSREPVTDAAGVDLTLIRWMLSMTPGERLEVLQRHVEAVLALRGRARE